MGDPRVDAETLLYWNALSDRLEAVVDGWPEPARAAMREVISLHCAWEKREQVLDGTDSDDIILGVGCRSCGGWDRDDDQVSPLHRPCRTVRELERHLLWDTVPNPEVGSMWTVVGEPGTVIRYEGLIELPWGIKRHFTFVETRGEALAMHRSLDPLTGVKPWAPKG